jgi:hypothetical protein
MGGNMMRKLTRAICLFLLMTVAPILRAQPLLFDSPPMIDKGLGVAESPSDVQAWDVPDTPFFILASHDVDTERLSLQNGGAFHQSTLNALGREPDGDGYTDHVAFKPGHPVDYGGI